MQGRERSLKRKLTVREHCPRILIICEDTKASPNYFNELRKFYGLHSADINIVPSKKSSPQDLADFAKKLSQEAAHAKNEYVHVFCVFDRDSHERFDDACQKVKSNAHIFARSWPCFEYWLSLHFKYNRRPFAKSSTKSASEVCESDLKKKHHPNYKKGDLDCLKIYMDTSKLETAVKNGKKSRQDAQKDNSNNPSTEVHKVVECLMNIRP